MATIEEQRAGFIKEINQRVRDLLAQDPHRWSVYDESYDDGPCRSSHNFYLLYPMPGTRRVEPSLSLVRVPLDNKGQGRYSYQGGYFQIQDKIIREVEASTALAINQVLLEQEKKAVLVPLEQALDALKQASSSTTPRR